MRYLLLIIFVFSGLPLCGDQEQSTYSYISVSRNGRYFFRMVPNPKDYWAHDSGYGVMYYAERDGGEKELWRIAGWYAFRTYPSVRGEYLVRIGNWPRGIKPQSGHLAIAFYHRGKLLKQYSTGDLVRKLGAGHRSIGHYRFWSRIPGFTGWDHRFTFISIDNIRYVFDAKTGSVLTKTQL